VDILLEEFADIGLCDDMLFWSSQARRIVSVKAVVPSEAKCRIEVTFEDGGTESVEYERGEFEATWDDSRTLIGAITGIQDDLSPLTADQVASLEADRQERSRLWMARLAKDVADARPARASKS
jgi:hypothetical protein